MKKELVKIIDLGPFKHTVDDGVPIRKSAFTLLQNMSIKFSINYNDVIDAVIGGFADTNDDVQMLCFNFMNKLIVICPMVVISKIDMIVEKFNMYYSKISPKIKNGNHSERDINLMRSILRVTEGLQRQPEALSYASFQ